MFKLELWQLSWLVVILFGSPGLLQWVGWTYTMNRYQWVSGRRKLSFRIPTPISSQVGLKEDGSPAHPTEILGYLRVPRWTSALKSGTAEGAWKFVHGDALHDWPCSAELPGAHVCTGALSVLLLPPEPEGTASVAICPVFILCMHFIRLSADPHSWVLPTSLRSLSEPQSALQHWFPLLGSIIIA